MYKQCRKCNAAGTGSYDTSWLEDFGTLRYKQVTPYTPMEPGNNFSFIIRRNDGSNQRIARYFTSSLLAGAAYTILLKGYMEPPDGDIGSKKSEIIFLPELDRFLSSRRQTTIRGNRIAGFYRRGYSESVLWCLLR
jgi:hypothetical protein